MAGDDPHANREISRGPHEPVEAAAAVWRAQHALAGCTGAASSAEQASLAAEVAAAQAAIGGRVFRVPTASLELLRREIETLARRADRLGMAPIALRELGNSGPYAFVALAGRAPVLAGWHLAAIVDHRGRSRALRAVSEHGEQLDAEAYRTARCEHCGLRRRRAETFIVVHVGSGRQRQVGSGCLRDFLGGHDSERACRQAEYLAQARGALAGAERQHVDHDRADEPRLEPFAAAVAHVVRRHGWVSYAQARRDGRRASADAALASDIAPNEGDRALAAGALRWARTLLPTKTAPTRFERAAAAITDGTTLDHRQRGIVAAVIGVYRRQRARSRHLGQPGAPLEITVLVERAREQPSRRHGVVRRNELLDVDVNRLAWWQTRGDPLPVGTLVTLRGRVARHTHFGTAAVTVLTRCRRCEPRAATTASIAGEALAAQPST
jgi:hypothetical protein